MRTVIAIALIALVVLVGGCQSAEPVQETHEKCVALCNSMSSAAPADACKQKCVDDYLNSKKGIRQ
jgi:uncharacterized protein YcfL